MAIGGGKNAGLMAIKILGTADPALRKKMKLFAKSLANESRRRDQTLDENLLKSGTLGAKLRP
jgi:5-(carboxyamino)imidazole ribonucleotide mutase